MAQRWIARMERAASALFNGRYARLLTFFFLLLSLLAIGGLVYANWEQFRTFEWQLRPIWIGYTLLSFAVTFTLSAFAWHTLIVHFAGHTTLRRNAKVWAYANLAKRIPGAVWYIASRAVLYEQSQVGKGITTLASGLELALILVSGLITLVITLPFWSFSPDYLSQSWLLLVLAPLCLLLIHPTVLNRLWRRLSPQSTLGNVRFTQTAGWVLLYLLIWSTGAAGLFSIINIIYPLPLASFPTVLGIWAIANTVSLAGALTLVNVGLREISLALLLIPLTSPPVALIVAVLVRVFWLIAEMVGGLLSLIL